MPGSDLAQIAAAVSAHQPSSGDLLRCARVALRQALNTADAGDARAWVESALRHIEEMGR